MQAVADGPVSVGPLATTGENHVDVVLCQSMGILQVSGK